MDLPLFQHLASLYTKEGYHLYLVGGASRDALLKRPFTDFDLATDATPEESLSFLPDLDQSFRRFGVLRYRGKDGQNADITTLREEGPYGDHRHPSYVRFVKDPRIDSNRRDFTINALYLLPNGEVLDYHEGLDDLRKGIIRFIGDPSKRIAEDPLRICRAERFQDALGFRLEKKTEEAIASLRPLLKELNPEKLQEERRKGWKGKL